MTTEQLRYFITVIDAGSYMEAALELNISQSTVSKQIQILERELGVSLFDRSLRKAKLTPEGEKLLPQARSLLKNIDRFFYSASMLSADNADQFTVITLPVVGFLNLYAPFNRFEVLHPGLRLKVVELEEPQLRKRLSCGDYDLAITYEHEFFLSGSDQRFVPVTEDEAVFAVNQCHPLSGCSKITLHDIADTPLLLMGGHTCIAKLCEDYFAENNFTPQVIFRGLPETLIAGVKAQRGCAIISRKQVMSFDAGDIRTISFEPPLTTVIGAIPNERSPRREYTDSLLSLLIPDAN